MDVENTTTSAQYSKLYHLQSMEVNFITFMLLYVTLYRVHFGPLIGYHFSANPPNTKRDIKKQISIGNDRSCKSFYW